MTRETKSKKFDDDVMSRNCDVIDIFPIYGQFGEIQKLDSGRIVRERNNGRSTDHDWPNFTFWPSRILCYHRNDRSYFSWTTGKDFVRDTSKALEIVQTKFKGMPHCFTDDNLVTTFCSVYIKLHRSIKYLLIDTWS